MKAELKFNLDDPEDRIAHLRCVKSMDIALSLWSVQQAIYRLEDRFDLDEIEDIKEYLFDKIDINVDELIQ